MPSKSGRGGCQGGSGAEERGPAVRVERSSVWWCQDIINEILKIEPPLGNH
jgi:hypothetical protein